MVAAKKNRTGSEKQFPGKLHDMMSFVEDNNLEAIISWELDGYGIRINNPEQLVEILPLFFGQTKYRSFRRQLNMWHFHRILEGPNKGTFVHPYFIKHNKAACSQMSRQLSFKSIIQKDEDYVSLVSCIEPDPIKELSSRDTNIKKEVQSLLKVSDLPISSSLPPLPKLPGPPGGSIAAALKTVEALTGSMQDWDLLPSNTWQQCFNDGDPVSFEGKNFFFLENDTPQVADLLVDQF